MTAKELAALLNGREYGAEITREEEAKAAESGLVTVFGASDDLCEFRGAYDWETGCWEGGTIFLDENGIAEIGCECENEACKLRQKYLASCKTIEAVWDSEGYSWTYKTDIPHETFDILEDGEKYCRGIVFEMAALR